MPKFPNWGVGTDVSAVNLANDVPNIITKASPTTITSNATLANDAELQNIALEVGTWEIETELFVSGNGTGAVGGFKNAWSFSGTTTGTPNRAVMGPASGNAGGAGGTVAMQTIVNTYTTSISYGLITGQPFWIRELCTSFVVATLGNLAIQVAQGTINATSTIVTAGSRVKCRRIA